MKSSTRLASILFLVLLSIALRAQNSYSYTGGNQTYTVPADGMLNFTVRGADGGNSNGNAGGAGATLTGKLSVSAGETVLIVVGGRGEGGTNDIGGGGGGGSAVIVDPTGSTPRPVVAAGGTGAWLLDSGPGGGSADGVAGGGPASSSAGGGGNDVTLTADVNLPVELISFTGRAEAKRNVLEWMTAREENFSHFELLRLSVEAGLGPDSSAGGWSSIGRVPGGAAGAMGRPRSYVFIDEQPLPAAYYRLRSVDFNGSSTLSGAVYLERAAAGALEVYPNPSTGRVTI